MIEQTPAEQFEARIKRVQDAVALRVPDRVPVFGPYQKYPYTFAGIDMRTAMNDYAAARSACRALPGPLRAGPGLRPRPGLPGGRDGDAGLQGFQVAGPRACRMTRCTSTWKAST